MLYDVLPPIFLFSSLGGIIITISRVLLRVRRQQFSENITPQPEDITVNEDQIFKPERKGINIFTNRLAVIPHAIRQTTTQTTNFLKDKKTSLAQLRQRRRQSQTEVAPDNAPTVDVPAALSSDTSSEQNITMPRSAWREKISAVTKVKGLGASLLNKAQKVRSQRAVSITEDLASSPTDVTSLSATDSGVATAEKPQTRPHLILRRTEAPISADSTEKSKSKVMDRLRKSSNKPAGKSILAQASDAIASAKYHQAEDILLPYIIKHARDAKAYMLLGQTALGQKDWSEAIEIFQQVLKLNPAEPGAHAALGYAALKAGRFTLALQTLQRAHEQDPQDLEVLKQLLRIAQRMDNSVLKRSISEKITALHASGQYH